MEHGTNALTKYHIEITRQKLPTKTKRMKMGEKKYLLLSCIMYYTSGKLKFITGFECTFNSFTKYFPFFLLSFADWSCWLSLIVFIFWILKMGKTRKNCEI